MTSDWLFWIGGGVAGTAGLWLILWALFWDSPRGRLRCPKCWYDMRESPSLTCSECGHTVARARKLRKTRRRWRWGLIALPLFAAAIAAGLTPQVKREGWASLVPTTVLILYLPHMKGDWDPAAHQLLQRSGQPFGSNTGWSDWQWRLLAHVCLMGDSERPPGSKAWYRDDCLYKPFLGIAVERGELLSHDATRNQLAVLFPVQIEINAELSASEDVLTCTMWAGQDATHFFGIEYRVDAVSQCSWADEAKLWAYLPSGRPGSKYMACEVADPPSQAKVIPFRVDIQCRQRDSDRYDDWLPYSGYLLEVPIRWSNASPE